MTGTTHKSMTALHHQREFISRGIVDGAPKGIATLSRTWPKYGYKVFDIPINRHEQTTTSLALAAPMLFDGHHVLANMIGEGSRMITIAHHTDTYHSSIKYLGDLWVPVAVA